eukprot:scaffold20903_cov99-Isochrysis_galbana.AAC.12
MQRRSKRACCDCEHSTSFIRSKDLIARAGALLALDACEVAVAALRPAAQTVLPHRGCQQQVTPGRQTPREAGHVRSDPGPARQQAHQVRCGEGIPLDQNRRRADGDRDQAAFARTDPATGAAARPARAGAAGCERPRGRWSRSGAKSEPARSSQRGGTSLHWGLRLRRETDRERTRYSQPAEPELAPLPEPFQRAAGGAACTATGDPSGKRLGVWKAKRKRGGAEEVAAAAGGRRADRQNQAVRALPHAN